MSLILELKKASSICFSEFLLIVSWMPPTSSIAMIENKQDTVLINIHIILMRESLLTKLIVISV